MTFGKEVGNPTDGAHVGSDFWLLFVLASFLSQTVLSRPVFYAAFGSLVFGLVFVLPIHVFMATALTASLHLSLHRAATGEIPAP